MKISSQFFGVALLHCVTFSGAFAGVTRNPSYLVCHWYYVAKNGGCLHAVPKIHWEIDRSFILPSSVFDLAALLI
jgi:hypothetical protein